MNKLVRGDIIYLIKDDKVIKNETYIIDYIEIVEDGNWHDGYTSTHYAYIKNTETNILGKEIIAITSQMNQYNKMYAINVEKCI